MVEAINVRVRYDWPDEKGATRRERNDLHDIASPEFVIPIEGRYLWDWYFNLSDCLLRVHDDVCWPIPPSEFMAWKEATGTIVYPTEYAILQTMDGAYRDALNTELSDRRERREEARKAEQAAAERKGRRRG